MIRPLTVKDVHANYMGEDVLLSLDVDTGVSLSLRIPARWRGLLSDVVLQGHAVKRPQNDGGRLTKRSLERMPSGEYTAARTAWNHWRRDSKMTMKYAAELAGLSTSTLLRSFRKYHAADFKRIADETGRSGWKKRYAYKKTEVSVD